MALSGKARRSNRVGLLPMEVMFLSSHVIATCGVHIAVAWCLLGMNDSKQVIAMAATNVLVGVFCVLKSWNSEEQETDVLNDDEDAVPLVNSE